VLEYCEGGELFDYIIERKHLNEKEAAMIFSQLLSALLYLHNQNISHRDIKPENFMLSKKGDIKGIKMIDFGLSKNYSGLQAMQTMSGSPYYIAPEVFLKNYNHKIDTWSMGVVLYIMLSGKVPFPGKTELEIINNVLKGEFHFNHQAFQNTSEECKDLIKNLINKNISDRFSCEQALSHQWIKKLAQNEGVQTEEGKPVSSQAFEDMQ
jgi:calcium-dependent protein kinase